ncbi:MAG: glycosyltransferase [Candidatus Thermoplasmatota archaeon]|nr:glycosyltransferase [Candidatus Thermoplasmatota archaeon]
MHVLQFVSWYPQNSEDISGSFFQEFANDLTKNGVKIGVLHAKFIDGLFNRENSEPITFTKENGVVVGRSKTRIRIPGPARRIPALERRDVQIRLEAGRLLYDEYVANNGTPDIIHAQACFWGGVIASWIANEEDIPFIVSAHSSVFGRGLVGKREKMLASKVWRNSKQNISVSQANADIICNMFNLSTDSFKIIPNGINSEDFVVRPAPKNPFKWIYIGNLVKNKRVDLLIEAMISMPQDHRLVVVGDGPMKSDLVRRSKELGDRIEFLGTVDRENIPRLLSECHALVHPSQFETFGVVLVEAMMCGRPVVAMRCGGPEEIVVDTTGHLVENGSVDGLIQAMNVVSVSDWDAEKIGEYARSSFDRKSVIRQFGVICNEIVSQKMERND